MNAPENRHVADSPPDSSSGASPDFDAAITALRTAGADRFDPVRFRYIEVLAERAGSHQGNVRRMLDARLAQALASLRECFALGQSDAKEILERGVREHPHAARDLQRLHGAGDFKAMRRLVGDLKQSGQSGQSASSSLGALVRQLEQRERHVPDNAGSHLREHAGLRPELRTIRSFKNTLSKLSVHKQVAQALEQAPKNAGPINSHMLVLRSLALMRDISPDYLNRFISYADALLCLDQGEKEKPAASPKPQKARTAKTARK
ncbi:DUF2894 domain-containing protein [Noviherbaspirillum sp. CPCC 100848]|uniref:DUF2894 domain-containing protein n=1 Tax=Noviherbaspirillum album TaxID=3080276 RepID=A0ABU6J302_9BURK|nr:DUF2894 domain-containing protein [Noviherbaspirillum sp. CPCC 100848]MEC4717994.1 DUF2894 domain-containing protein [Noviherbaspirillum sp. CPCC 100848]